jgi:hypothetical protein
MRLKPVELSEGMTGTNPDNYYIIDHAYDVNSIVGRHAWLADVWVDEDGNYWLKEDYNVIRIDRFRVISTTTINGVTVEIFETETETIGVAITKDGDTQYMFKGGRYDIV